MDDGTSWGNLAQVVAALALVDRGTKGEQRQENSKFNVHIVRTNERCMSIFNTSCKLSAL